MSVEKTKHLYLMILRRAREVAINGLVSYPDFRRVISYPFRCKKHDSKIILQELENMKYIQRGQIGFRILTEEGDDDNG